MIQGIWRELGPLIVLAHLPELLAALAAGAALAVSVWWGVRRRARAKQAAHWRAKR